MIRLASIATVGRNCARSRSPERPGFLGMKLHAEDVVAFEHRRVLDGVVASRRGRVDAAARSSYARSTNKDAPRRSRSRRRSVAAARSRSSPCAARAHRRESGGLSPSKQSEAALVRELPRSIRTDACRPRQIPRNGTPARMRSSSALAHLHRDRARASSGRSGRRRAE